MSGIYKIQNTVNGKCYVGSAVDLGKRWGKHRSELRRGVHQSPTLSAAWAKYGEGAFAFVVLLVCSRHDLLLYEQRAMDVLKPRYNIRLIAMSNFGLKQTAETITKRMKDQFGNKHTLGYRHTAETRAKMAATRTGKKHTPEWNEKIAAAHRGKKLSHEHCLIISRIKQNISAETRLKMSIAKKGRKLTLEQRANMSAAHRRRLLATAQKEPAPGHSASFAAPQSASPLT